MTTSFRKLGLTTLLLSWFLLPAGAHAACSTSLESLNGWYGMLVSGTNDSDGSLKYLAGAVLFDGAGNVSGSNIYSGSGTRSALTGTYVLNSDCSITITLSIGGGATQAYSVGVRTSTNEAVGIEVDSVGVATIDLQAQYSTYTTGLNFTSASANGTFTLNCLGSGVSDLNLVTFSNGTLSGTDAYNDTDSLAVDNTPFTGTYSVNSDGTLFGSLSILGGTFDFFGVLSNSNTKIQYFYSTTSPIAPFAACSGSSALTSSPSFGLSAAAGQLSVVQGQSVSDVVSVTATNGFGGVVSFSASGLPAGATAAFNPASSSTGSKLTVTAGATTTPGTYTVVVAGASGNINATTSITLDVTSAAVQGFTLAPASATLTLPQNTGGTDAITVTPVNGFTGTVNLAVTGAPTGASTAFVGNTLVVFAASSTAAGSYPLTITGTSGNVTASTTVTLVITSTAKPSFTLAPASGTLQLAQNTGGTDAITVTPANGFTGTVNLAVTGAPTGASTAFVGNTLVVFAASSTAAGSYPLTVTGTSGSVTAKTTVTLVITAAPAFSLSASPTSITLLPLGSASDAITVVGANGFNGVVTFSVSGLPSGVSGTFRPASSSSSTTLTLSASLLPLPGRYTVTISGTAGGTTKSTTIMLVVL
jgi:hypothetical protein